MREHHVCGLHCLDPYCAWHVDGGGPDQRVRSSALAGGGGSGVFSLCPLWALSGAGRSANAAPGVINLVYLPLSFCGGLWMPIEVLPHWLQSVAHCLPSYWFSRMALRSLGYSSSSPFVAWGSLAAYTILFLLAA